MEFVDFVKYILILRPELGNALATNGQMAEWLWRYV